MLYAWARNAPQLVLPPDVGFMVGRDSDVQYLVLQVSAYLHIITAKKAKGNWSGYVG